MAFFNQAITVLQTLVVAIGAGLGIWGIINLLEGYGNDNPGADGLYGLKVGSREEIRQAILDERHIELCYEGHRFWDLRRTRNMMMLAGWTKHGIEAIAVNPDGSDMDLNVARDRIAKNELTTGDFRYVIHQVPYTEAAERQFVIEESFYFFPIKKTYLDENPNLEQNNNWGGTFNPTMEQ